MPAEIIDGKKVAASIREQLKREVLSLKEKEVIPGLAVVLVGNNPASKKYVSSKEKACAEIGIRSFAHEYPEDVPESEILRLIGELNGNPEIHGILVQLPLPRHIREKEVMQSIAPSKDVDGFGPVSLGRLVLDEPGFIPCTPHGVMKMLDAYGVNPEGKHAVIIGRSVIVGKPLSLLLLRRNATVTMCHSRTPNLKDECLRADILCVAAGKAKLVTGDMIRDGAVVIDVGINVTDENKIVGDVDFEAAREKASFITPVPGGAGPMTIAMLMDNTVLSAKLHAGTGDTLS